MLAQRPPLLPPMSTIFVGMLVSGQDRRVLSFFDENKSDLPTNIIVSPLTFFTVTSKDEENMIVILDDWIRIAWDTFSMFFEPRRDSNVIG